MITLKDSIRQEFRKVTAQKVLCSLMSGGPTFGGASWLTGLGPGQEDLRLSLSPVWPLQYGSLRLARLYTMARASQVAQVVKNPVANAGDKLV